MRKEILSARVDADIKDAIDQIAQQKSEQIGVTVSRSAVVSSYLKKMIEQEGLNTQNDESR